MKVRGYLNATKSGMKWSLTLRNSRQFLLCKWSLTDTFMSALFIKIYWKYLESKSRVKELETPTYPYMPVGEVISPVLRGR